MILMIKVIVAEGEIKASLALRQAAENIAGSPESLQVEYFIINNQTSTNLEMKTNQRAQPRHSLL